MIGKTDGHAQAEVSTFSSITDAAADRIREIIDDSEAPIAGVRVGVKNAGCAGMAYTLDSVSNPDPG